MCNRNILIAGLVSLVVATNFPVPAASQGLPQVRAELFTDIRAWAADGEPSWLDDGMGKGRYGGHPDLSSIEGITVAEMSALIDVDVTWDLAGYFHLQYGDYQDKPVDLVEGFFTWRPAPTAAVSFDLKGGLYYPHISRENTGPAWTTPYSITASAANSWVGEEIRALGLQGGATWRGDAARVHFTAALFGFNDPAGTLLAYRGWAVSDIKVGAFSRLPLPPIPAIGEGGTFIPWQPHWVHPVMEIDGRLGWHAGLDWDYGQHFSAGAFYYDNGGDPAAFENDQYAWDTRFLNLYLEVKPRDGFTILTQYMDGVTLMGRFPDGVHRAVDVSYDTGFLLLSQEVGAWRFTGRGEYFKVRDNSYVDRDDNNEEGTAWTLAVGRDFSPRDRVILEVLNIDSQRPARETIGYASDQSQTLLQASYRKRF